MFKKIIFVTGLLNINNIKCSEKELNKIKEKINEIYDYSEEPIEIYSDYISSTLKKKFDIGRITNEEKAVNIANDISAILKVKICNKNEYFHFIKGSFLLRKYLNGLINDIENLKNLDIITTLDNFTKKYSSYKFTNKAIFGKLKNIIDIIEEVKGFLNQTIIKIEIDNLIKRVKEVNFVKFNDKEFDYIKDDYFDNNNELNEEYKNLKDIKGKCLLKFLISDDLDLDGYFPKHWKTSLKTAKQYEVLKRNVYNYDFCNEGIINKEDNDVIKSSEELQNKFNKEKKELINTVLKNITKYNKFGDYLKILEKFNNSINVLNTDDNLNFLDELINNYDNVLKIDDDSVNLNTEIHVISHEDKVKIGDISEKFKEQLSILENIKSIFKDFSNEKYNKFYKKIEELKQKNDPYKKKSDKIKEIKNEINTLISKIKTKINTLTENNNGLEDKYKVTVPTISDEDYNNKTKNELNTIEINLEGLEKAQEENREKQKNEKDKEILKAAKSDEEKSKIQDNINLRKQILTKIIEICENFEKEYNPTENDNKSKIEEKLVLKLNEYKDIKSYLEDEFNKEKGLSKTLEDDLNSEKTKTINNCELKLNKFLQKKKEEEEKKGNSDDENNKNIEGDNKYKGKEKCCCRNKGENNNKSKKGKCCCQ